MHRHPRRDGPHAGEPAELQFWQQTGATIVAIHRNLDCIVSPGPCAELYAGDSIVYVGDGQAREAVSRFFA